MDEDRFKTKCGNLASIQCIVCKDFWNCSLLDYMTVASFLFEIRESVMEEIKEENVLSPRIVSCFLGFLNSSEIEYANGDEDQKKFVFRQLMTAVAWMMRYVPDNSLPNNFRQKRFADYASGKLLEELKKGSAEEKAKNAKNN